MSVLSFFSETEANNCQLNHFQGHFLNPFKSGLFSKCQAVWD